MYVLLFVFAFFYLIFDLLSLVVVTSAVFIIVVIKYSLLYIDVTDYFC